MCFNWSKTRGWSHPQAEDLYLICLLLVRLLLFGLIQFRLLLFRLLILLWVFASLCGVWSTL